MKKYILIISFILLISSFPAFPQYASTAFYVIAHQDDWQLFMGKDAYEDISDPSQKVVFVYLTNGDACNKTGVCGYNIPYYVSRENGAKNSAYLVADKYSSHPAGKDRPVNNIVTIGQHQITKWQYKNVIKYFLRLPDGHINFDHPPHFRCGFNPGDSTYINYFRRNVLHKLSDVTGLTMYKGWNDLVNTVRTILIHENTGNEARIHTHEFSPLLNVSTHPDHRETGLIIENFSRHTPGFRIHYHLDYVTYNMPVNLSHSESMKESGLFAAYNTGKINDGCPTDWKEDDLQFCLRNYISRTINSLDSAAVIDNPAGFLSEVRYNPGFRSTTLSIILPFSDTLSCQVYDIRGNLVYRLIDNLLLSAGKHDFVIHHLPDGLYILKIYTLSGYHHQMKLLF